MSRTAHVLDPAAPGCGVALCDALSILQEEDSLVILGGCDRVREAEARGVVVDGAVPMPLRVPRLASPQLARVLRTVMNAPGRGPIGRIMAWSESALVAALGADHRVPVVGQIAAVSGRPPRIEPWRRSRARVHPIGPEIGPQLARRGWRIGEARSATDFPMQDVAHRSGRRVDRAGIRRQWGVEGANELVVAMSADPPSSSALSTMLTAAATAGVAGRGLTLVADPASGQAMAAARRLIESDGRLGGEAVRLVFDERVRDPRVVAPAVDVVVTIDRTDAPPYPPVSVLALRAWLACGVPLITSDRRNAASLVEDGVDGRLLPIGDRNSLIQVLMRMVDEPSLAVDMGHAAAARHGRGLVSGRPDWLRLEDYALEGRPSVGMDSANPMAASR
ncbi:MAG: hypothetical protein CBB69_005395 [Phycisphaera sp. TMED9]|nr:MAG: hypothetical protein CBB69_005395 [Phycisphaera sp. TMED9]